MRRTIRDGSFFILTQERSPGAAPAFKPEQTRDSAVDFDSVMNRIQASIRGAPKLGPAPKTPERDAPRTIGDTRGGGHDERHGYPSE